MLPFIFVKVPIRNVIKSYYNCSFISVIAGMALTAEERQRKRRENLRATENYGDYSKQQKEMSSYALKKAKEQSSMFFRRAGADFTAFLFV